MTVQIPVLDKILRTVLVYALIVVIFRIIGKTAISSMNTMDFVVMFLLSNVVQNAIIGDDDSLLGGVIGAVTLVVVNQAVDRLAYRDKRFRHLVEGRPTVVVREGRVDEEALRRLGIRHAELDHAVRVQNGDTTDQVWSGVMEPGGQLVLDIRPADQAATQADVQALTERLARIEALLIARPDGPAAT
ncbi:DUF421 domain-containing protein [Nakamurella flavida]|uniref:DUF421 domain-containing protein n=1 Tax=Nakamurella flavida TaxID=363630 RepID=A0A939C3X2_9ACTN|nr:YetF domain-containing protein [Nakamurella flavida]MBM9475049.1 DUF421 domain-containing protein [Nakamurella flavida]MDP9776617.1 uncharacterized membrane protein YcaP (DUF421 family) [Nakamurella flavida]